MQQELRRQNDSPGHSWWTVTILLPGSLPNLWEQMLTETCGRKTTKKWFDFRLPTKAKKLQTVSTNPMSAVRVYSTVYTGLCFPGCVANTTNFMCDWVLEMCWTESIFRAHLFMMRFMLQNTNNLFWIIKPKSPHTCVTAGRTDSSESISPSFFPPSPNCFPPSLPNKSSDVILNHFLGLEL